MTSRRSLMAVLALAMLVSIPGVSRGQGSDDLSEARDKYESASYAEALTSRRRAQELEVRTGCQERRRRP